MTFPVLGGNGAVGVTGYQIDNSLRFNRDIDNASLTRTPSSAGNRKTWTFSAWVKRCIGAGGDVVLGYSSSANDYGALYFHNNPNDGLLRIYDIQGGNFVFDLSSNHTLRDVSAWYHFVISADTTQATASNRLKMYINGVQVTSFATATYPSQNADLLVNNNCLHAIGRYADSNSGHIHGYMAEINFIDGQQLSPTDFGEFDSASGIWKPKAYSGSYGTNGFYLDFENSGSLGADSSGNGNNFTPTNLASTDQMPDTPTKNFCTLNSTRGAIGSNSSNTPLFEGNLKALHTDNAYKQSEGTIFPTAGKWYWETLITNSGTDAGALGIVTSGQPTGAYPGTTINGYGYDSYGSGSKIHNNSRDNSYGTSYGTNDIMGTALDLDNGTLTFYKNNTSQGQAYSGIDASLGWSFGQGSYYATNGIVVNFGQDSSFAGNKTAQNNSDDNGEGDFYYTPPSGFLALNSTNLATELSPTIDDGSQYFNTILYTGTGTTQSITGVGFQPDLVWLKARTQAYYLNLYDIIRGGTKAIFSNADVPEATDTGNLQTLDSDGFTADGFAGTNGSGVSYVAWNWLASNTTASNSNGSITSTVSVNQTSGFSIVTYTGTGANATVGHGLGKVPAMMIIKNRSASANWIVYHQDLGNNNAIVLNSTGASFSAGDFQNTTPTSSVFSIGTSTSVNGSGNNIVAYTFADIEGYSKTGKYTGNASTDGTFIYTGFKPSWVMIKRIDGANGWNIFDSARNPTNVVEKLLFANSTAIEEADVFHNNSRDYLSNGFKIRETGNDVNVNGSSYLYIAFASNPFVSSSGIPVTAR